MIAPTRTAKRPGANAGDTPLGPDWWRSDTIVTSRLRDLVGGLDGIGSFAIPYARLPRRLGVYAADFPRWADVAGLTPRELLARPKLGATAVQALIEAGREAVRVRRDTVGAGTVCAESAVNRLVGQLDDFDRVLLSAQAWATDPGPQRVVAEQLGVHPVSVTRNLPRARARFAELLADPAHHEVGEHAVELRRRLGPYLPAELARVELRRLGVEPSGHTAEVLLHVAGPYARRGQWVESIAGAVGGQAQAVAAVDGVFDGDAAPSTDALLRALTVVGMPTGVALTYLEGLALKRFGDLWVRWTGDATANMAEAVLHVLGAPATAEAVLDTIGSEGGSLANVNRVLSKDDRFVRATRRTWGLRAWGIAEYAGIAHAIGARIDARGGEATVKEVIADLLASYPDITETSIRTYLGTLEFITKGGVVRRRTTADGWPPVPPLRTVRGAFRNGANEIRVAIPVTSDLLRGSGQTIHPAVAVAAGVTPGEQRTFTSTHDKVTLYWKLSSTTGANVDSLRSLAGAVQATNGDTLVLALRAHDASLEVTRLGSDDLGMPRLQKLLGRQIRRPVAAMATALDCRRDDVGAVLRARGDHELASMLGQDLIR
jgi:hypothetical protein